MSTAAEGPQIHEFCINAIRVSEAIEASEEAALGQRLHGIATQRQQLQLAEDQLHDRDNQI
jgi:hypothetical protein